MATTDVNLTATRKQDIDKTGYKRMRGGKYVRYTGAGAGEHFVATVWCRDGYTPSKITVTYTT